MAIVNCFVSTICHEPMWHDCVVHFVDFLNFTLNKVSTKAPLECMCRPCSGVEETSIVPQEIAGYTDEGPLNNHFRKAQLQ